MSRRAAATIAAILGVVLVLAGCTGRAGTEAAAGGGGTATLTWWMVTQPDTATAAIKKIIGDYQSANPDVKVNVQYRGIDVHKEALRTASGSGSGPDLYFMWAGPGLGGEFVDAGSSLDLTKYYDQYGWKDRFAPATLTNYTQYGGYHGVPWTQRGEVLFYNKDLFEKAGVTAAPATYDELVAAAEKLKAAGITPIAFGGKDNWHVMRLLDSIIETKCGAAKGDALNTRKASWAGEPCVDESFAELKKWSGNYFNKGYVGMAQSEAASVFFTGKAAMALEGDWFTQNIADNGGDLSRTGTFVFPTGTDRLYGFSEAQYISKSSKNPDAAAKFADYLTSTDVQNRVAGVFAALSVNEDAKAAGDAGQAGIATDFAGYFKNAKGYYLNNDQNFPLDVTTEYWRIQNSVVTGKIDPADAGAQLQKFIDTHKN